MLRKKRIGGICLKFFQKNRLPLLLAAAVALTAVCWWNSYLFSTRPFAGEYAFDGPSGVFHGGSGNTYVVDSARREILILDGDLAYVRTIEGGSKAEGSFYYATAVADGPEGIYVADALYSGEGTIVQAERILRFETDGSGGEVLYQFDYEDEDAAPRQNGRIKSLALDGNVLRFTMAQGDQVEIYSYDLSTGGVESVRYSFGNRYVFTANWNSVTGLPMAVTGDGAVMTVSAQGDPQVLVQSDESIYQAVVTPDGTVWYSIPTLGALMQVGPDGEEEFITDEVFAYYISSYGDAIYASDGAGIAVWEDGGAFYTDTVPIANALARNVMWLLLFLDALVLLILLLQAMRYVVRSWLSYPFFRKIAVVILVAVVGASAAAWYILHTTFQEENDAVMVQLDGISDEIVAATDVELLKGLQTKEDYKTDPYNELKAGLDDVINRGYERGEYFYYLTYVTDRMYIYALMDYEDSVLSWQLFDVYGTEIYTDVFETGQPELIEGEVSAWGSWTLMLKPVLDADGQVIAVQEVGFNYDNQRIAQQETIFNTILTIFFGAIVLVMLMIEGIYFTEHRRKRRELQGRTDVQLDHADVVPLRTLIFMAFTVDCMQDAFISILTTQLYVPFLGIPQSVGAALPISGQVLMAAIFAVLGGFMANRFGAKRVIGLGFLLEASGFLLCGTLLNYFGILLGKLLAGAGIGLVTVGVNTTAASAVDKSKTVATFAGITAGTLAGVSAGSGLGSTLLSFGGHRVVFFTGAVILLCGFLLTVGGTSLASWSRRRLPETGEEEEPEETVDEKIGIGGFLFGKGGTLPFLAMVLMPFMMGIYFRDYFFPVFSAENGLTEVGIGRIYVLCGLLVIYMGPPLTKYLEEHLGGVRMVLLTSGLLGLASLSFGVLPTMAGAVIGLLLLSVAVSVGYTAQSSYYSVLPKVEAFGEGRAMGVYSLFDNGGQTLGSIVYGYAMLLGYQVGMFSVGSALLLLTGAFGLLKRKELKKEKMARGAVSGGAEMLEKTGASGEGADPDGTSGSSLNWANLKIPLVIGGIILVLTIGGVIVLKKTNQMESKANTHDRVRKTGTWR